MSGQPETATAAEWLAGQNMSEEEATAASRGLLAHREQLAAISQLRELTPFEQELVERAYLAGRADIKKALAELVGPAARTVDAQSLVRGVDARAADMTFIENAGWVELGIGPDQAGVRAAKLVAGVHRRLDRERELAARHQLKEATDA